MVETDQDTNIKKVFFIDTKIAHDTTFGDRGEGRFRGNKVDRNDKLVDAWIEKAVSWPVDGMDIRFWVALEIYQLDVVAG